MCSVTQDIVKALQEIKKNGLDLENDIRQGEHLFELFCDLGLWLSNFSSVISENDMKTIAQLVVDIGDWLLLFLSHYTDEIHISDSWSLSTRHLKTRSGIAFLFQLFKDIDVIYPGSQFDIIDSAIGSKIKLSIIFDQLTSEVNHIDSTMTASKSICYSFNKPPENVPTSHHWWY